MANLPLWTADADHFTVDNPQHTADGWHTHGGGGGSGYGGVQYDIRLLNADDEALMLAIKAFVRLEA